MSTMTRSTYLDTWVESFFFFFPLSFFPFYLFGTLRNNFLDFRTASIGCWRFTPQHCNWALISSYLQLSSIICSAICSIFEEGNLYSKDPQIYSYNLLPDSRKETYTIVNSKARRKSVASGKTEKRFPPTNRSRVFVLFSVVYLSLVFAKRSGG